MIRIDVAVITETECDILMVETVLPLIVLEEIVLKETVAAKVVKIVPIVIPISETEIGVNVAGRVTGIEIVTAETVVVMVATEDKKRVTVIEGA